jgi:hypothetical protein
MQYPKSRDDMADPVTRAAAPAQDRLTYICERAAIAFGRDPRGGGFSFVGQPSVLEYVVSQLSATQRNLQRPVVIGTNDAEVIAWWVTPTSRIPFRCSYRARDAQVWVVPDDLLVQMTQLDRRAAAEIRMALHKGEIRIVQ